MSLPEMSSSLERRLVEAYEVPEPRDFHSTIPHHLLSRIPDDERFVIEAMSKLENEFNWLGANLLKVSGSTRALSAHIGALEKTLSEQEARLVVLEKRWTEQEKFREKVDALWDWKQLLSGKWVILAGVAAIILPFLVKFFFDLIAHSHLPIKP